MLYTIEQKSRKNQTNTLKHTAKMKWYKKQSDKNMYTNNPKSESQRNVAYIKKKTKNNRHQHKTDDGVQAMGEEMRHVQMSR